jgi:hypothetical protein
VKKGNKKSSVVSDEISGKVRELRKHSFRNLKVKIEKNSKLHAPLHLRLSHGYVDFAFMQNSE